MTLLETVWGTDGDEEEVVETVATALEQGDVELTGNFRGWEETEPAGFWR